MIPSRIRVGIQVKGIVQGVGFRPFVFRLAKRFELTGFVRNEGGWVYIEVSGPSEKVDSFIKGLKENPPPLSRIDEILVKEVPTGGTFPDLSEPSKDSSASSGYSSFQVLESRNTSSQGPGIPPDSALCDACRRELLDPKDRRYLYPFINCTDCGPRFTIVEKAPYDRKRTSMRKFPMCPMCQKEYLDPEDRRFHAEPDACWDCGPKATYRTVDEYLSDDGRPDKVKSGYNIDRGDRAQEKPRDAWLREAQDALMKGKILAVKGVGGYHIACDALNGQAIRTLRQRKHRPRKPLAVMVKDLNTVKEWFYVSKAEEERLAGKEAPIVLLRKKDSCKIHLDVAPGLDHFGIMLPYSPLHFLLFQPIFSEKAPVALCMTSGNVSGLPLEFQDEEALRHLSSIVDGFIFHDRDILRPCDDSVLRVFHEETLFYRRSRGYVPDILPPNQAISHALETYRNWGSSCGPYHGKSYPKILGAGAEGKNVFCLLDESGVRLSQHIGDLFNEESLSRYSALARDFTSLYGFEPSVVAVDLHPDYQVNRVIRAVFPDAKLVKVQHHHAHMASCLAEWGIDDKVVGIVADGTGYGLDGRIWGGEILYGDAKESERLYHLDYVRMPGGEKAVEEPWRMAISYLRKAFGDDGLKVAKDLMPDFASKIEFLWPLIDRDQFPETSSTGRFFDAVGALLGVSDKNSYDGEMASLLGEMALSLVEENDLKWGGVGGVSVVEENKGEVIPLVPIIRRVVHGVLSAKDKRQIALDFHMDLARTFGAFAIRACRQKGASIVTLSGGVFQNPVLLRLLVDYLGREGLKVFWPQAVPPNDGGICLGQAFTALCRGGIE